MLVRSPLKGKKKKSFSYQQEVTSYDELILPEMFLPKCRNSVVAVGFSPRGIPCYVALYMCNFILYLPGLLDC